MRQLLRVARYIMWTCAALLYKNNKNKGTIMHKATLRGVLLGRRLNEDEEGLFFTVHRGHIHLIDAFSFIRLLFLFVFKDCPSFINPRATIQGFILCITLFVIWWCLLCRAECRIEENVLIGDSCRINEESIDPFWPISFHCALVISYKTLWIFGDIKILGLIRTVILCNFSK